MLFILSVAITLVAVYYLVVAVRPLIEAKAVSADEWQRIDDESADLLARRDRLIEELRDLEFEAALDKISAADLAALRARFEREAVSVSRALDERAEGYTDRIESAVADRLSRAGASGDGAEGDAAPEIEQPAVAPEAPAGTAAPGARVEPAASASAHSAPAGADECLKCGVGLAVGAAFCDACGTPANRCAQCQSSNRAGARFCRGCGAPFSVAGAA